MLCTVPWPLLTQRRKWKTATTWAHREEDTSRCTSSSPVQLLQVRDAHKSQRTTTPFNWILFQDVTQIRSRTYLLLGTCWKSNGYRHVVKTDSWRVPLHMPVDFSVPQVRKLEIHLKSPLFHCSTSERLVINLDCKMRNKNNLSYTVLNQLRCQVAPKLREVLTLWSHSLNGNHVTTQAL